MADDDRDIRIDITGDAAAQVRGHAATFEIHPQEVVRRALLLFGLWASLTPVQHLAVYDADTKQVEKCAFRWGAQ